MKISEFANATCVSVETVRYYQREGLLNTPSSDTGMRQYTDSHIDQIQFIKNAKLAGFSLSEIKQLSTFDAVADRKKMLALSEQKKMALKFKIQELKDAMTFIESLVKECKSSQRKPCPILEGLRYRT